MNIHLKKWLSDPCPRERCCYPWLLSTKDGCHLVPSFLTFASELEVGSTRKTLVGPNRLSPSLWLERGFSLLGTTASQGLQAWDSIKSNLSIHVS